MLSEAEILELALDMTEAQRASMARKLLISLDQEPGDPDVDTLWAAELELRSDATHAAEGELVDWRVAVERIQSTLQSEKSA